jgi:prohibitin 2
MTEEGIWKLIKWVVSAVVVIILVAWLWPLTSVGAGQVGVVTVFGKVQNSVLEPGLHLVNPLAKIHKISLQTQTIDFDNQSKKGNDSESSSLFAATKDLQDVQIAVVVTYHLPAGVAKDVYQQYQGLENFQSSKISPIVREAVKAASAQYTAEELVTKRAEVSDVIDKNIRAKFSELNTIAESFKIVNLEFSPEFTKAIELKATAVQNAEASKNKLEQVKYEAQQQIESAKAQAETIRIQAEAINKQGGKDYVQLKAIEKWNGNLPQQMIPGSSVPFINLTQ